MLRNLLLSIATVAIPAMAYDPITLPVIPPDPEIEKKVSETLSKMTLEEKIGQMTQIQLDILGETGPDGKFRLVKEKVDTVIGIYKVGSILNAPYSYCLDAESWNVIIPQIQEASMKYIGIPCVYGLDQNHGTTYTNGGTLFPQNLNVAASFDTELCRKAAEITAYETRASDCPWTFSPTMDLARDPRWPRFWENYGEDPLVNALMGAAAVRGFQGNDPNHIDKNHIAVSLKHFMGYGVPFSGKDRTPAYISPSDLREKHFAPYLEAIKYGALTIMVNSSSINGTPVHADPLLLTKWLKEDLQWDGLIVTDWADINNLYTREKVAKDKKDAIRIAINAGIDMAMEPYKVDYCDILRELVEEGKVSMSRIDDAASRALRLKYRLGLFDRPNTLLKDYPKFASEEFRKAALDGAAETMVLLKNDNNILPLSKGTRIMVTGPTATSMRSLNGGWSYTWQGHLSDTYAKDYNTILEALTEKFGESNVTYVPTVTFNQEGSYQDETVADSEAALKAAANADVIVACIGENSYCETPGNLTDLYLSSNQRDMIKALAKTGKPIVLVVNEGRPRILADIEPLAKGIIDIIIPGNFGGDALAELMVGERNFSAKLPFTYPREINSLVTYDYKVSEEVGKMEGVYDYDARVNVQWPFGYGKSYTTFEYSDLKVDKTDFTPTDVLTVSVNVTNTGSRDGKEAVLLFSSDLVASIVPDNKRLRGFVKIALMPGETRTVKFTLPATDLAFVNAHGQWTLEEGDFSIKVGNLSVPVHCTTSYTWDRPNI
ncbi:glycoside hydrolase family 3 N-terminal domain-containing protein [uncultured Duncaniella sp.]|uniref:glycoside hydrolase family 3 N-terminal domain-containing protein n=1 Tax=uncultured Duncaniella sp. TaxID=2768039 RepID=UPI0025F128C3|nr:glycoside hydrolase family 3 N-terminal domain-containing protein [uncultured Duncaniella sp.]